MDSCTVEAINALWTGVGYGVAVTVIIAAFRYAVAHFAKIFREGELVFAMAMAGIFAMGGLIPAAFNSQHFAQQALRYAAAQQAGHACEYDNKRGNVTVVR